MNIGEVASLSGLPTQTIRYYEGIGLVAPGRRANGFRDYGTDDVRRLRFIGRVRGLGFSVDECRELISFFDNVGRVAPEAEAVAQRHLQAIQRKLAELRALQAGMEACIAGTTGTEDFKWSEQEPAAS